MLLGVHYVPHITYNEIPQNTCHTANLRALFTCTTLLAAAILPLILLPMAASVFYVRVKSIQKARFL